MDYEIVIRINELENKFQKKFEGIYKFNQENNNTIAKLFENERKRNYDNIEIFNDHLNIIKLLLLIISISISFYIYI